MTSAVAETSTRSVRSLVPARMDRLPWTEFHWLVVVGLGVSWILDGLEIQIVSLIATPLTDPRTLGLTTGQAGFLGSMYLIGEVVGALVFGRLTDKLGRKKLFIITLAIYLIGSGMGGFAWDYWSLLFCRFVAGCGIGGEYTAINSAIDELIPSKYRGRVDIAVNGTYWGGAAIGAAMGLYLFSQPRPDRLGLAHRLLHRPGARPDHHLHPAHDPGKPSLADDAWPQRRGRADRRRDRGTGQARGCRTQAGRRRARRSKSPSIHGSASSSSPRSSSVLTRNGRSTASP